MMIPRRSNMNICVWSVNWEYFVSFYWINNTFTIFRYFHSSFVMCENTLDEKQDVLFQCLLLNHVDRLMTPLIHDDDDSQPVCLSIHHEETNVHWHRRVTTGVRSEMNTDTLNWKCDYLESKYMNIISEKNK